MNLPEFTIKLSMKSKVKELHQINTASQTADVLRKIFNADDIIWREEMVIICLNRSNRVLGYHKLSSGAIDATIVDVRIIAQIALLSNATGVVIAHNHPSGNTEPSEADKHVTAKIQKGLAMLEIKLWDHIILTEEDFYSFADSGNM